MLRRDPIIQRFILFIRIVLPVVMVFALSLLLVAINLRIARMWIGTSGVLLFGGTLALAHRSLMRNEAEQAAYWVAGGALGGTLLLTSSVPHLYIGTGLVPLLVAIVLLQYTSPQQSRRALILCGITCGFVVLLGQIDVQPLLNEQALRLLNAAIVLVNSGVAMLLLWHLTSYLHEAIGSAQTANTALVSLNNRLQRELHEHQRTMTALHASEQQGQALLHAIPDALFRLHRNGNVLDLKYFDHTESNSPYSGTVAGEINALLPTRELIEQAIATQQVQQYERQFWRGSKIWVYEGRVVAVDEHEVVVIVRDVTEARAVEQLKAEFISTVSHELRTPLTAVRGAVSLIVGGVAGDVTPQVRSMLDIAARNCERLLKLVNDILDVDQLESGKLPMKFQIVPLAPLIEQTVLANLAYGALFRVALEVVQPLPEVDVQVDTTRLAQALTNLISNAVKFSPPDDKIVIGATTQASIVRITVSDRGPGIDEAFRGRIFQRFAQADSSNTRAVQGSGLGLSITKAIVEQSHGQIDFYSEPGGGTTFFIDLPVVREE